MNPRKLLTVLITLVVALGVLAGVSGQPASAAPTEVTAEVTVVRPVVQQRDANCSDFGSQASAQQYFLNHGGPSSDPDGLDSDGDGVACESNPCPCSTSQGGGGGGDQPPAQQSDFGAIALNLKGRSGTSKDVATKNGALRQAVRSCNRATSPRFRCVRIGAVKDGCAAVWFSLDDRGNVVNQGARQARFATGRTLAKASRGARNGRPGGRVVRTCA